MSSSRKEIKTWTRESRIEQESFISSSSHTSSALSQRLWDLKITETENVSSHLGESLRRPSMPLITDTVPFQEPRYSLGYQSPFQRRSGPFASLRPNSNQNTATTNNGQQVLRNASSSNISQRAAASSEPFLTTASQTALVPTYHISGKPKGKVLIININKFLTEKDERSGSENDLKVLKKLFKDSMGFHVSTYTDLKASGILQRIEEFKSDKSLAKYDISIVVLMSHGSNIVEKQEICGGFTQIFGADGKAVITEDILSKFNAKQCPGMLGKPKIFIFQCCRGKRFESLATDAPKSAANMHGDMLIAYSTLPGFYSIRNEEKGSWYIQSLCKIFKDHASKCHVENLLKIVQDDLNNNHPEYKQTSTYENRGFKRCYLQKST